MGKFGFKVCNSNVVTFKHILYLIQLWKESLNSDGQQFHQYQQRKHLTSDLNSSNIEKTTTYDIRNPGPGVGLPQICFEIKPAYGIPIIPSGYLDLQRQYIYKQTIQNLYVHSLSPYTITKMYDNIDMDSTIAGAIHARS